MLEILSEKKDKNHPVAFASNILFALELNGFHDAKANKNLLFPILKQKAQYLHAEGISGSILAISKTKDVNEEAITSLLSAATQKNFTSIKYSTMSPYSISQFNENDNYSG
jgi:hypothetical protein